jgi:2-phosphosulfolactate phosphatase
MSLGPPAQAGYALRFEWGLAGAATVDAERGALVIVDVLSFTTAVSIAVQRGVAVYPAAWRDDRAADLAVEVDAVLAVGRREMSADHPWSLSPAALLSAPAPPRLVLPSPNGATIAAAAAATGGAVVAACLRNVRAVACWLRTRPITAEQPVTVVAAGERWPDGSLRPALEDLIGAGAVINALMGAGVPGASPEAEAARAVFSATVSIPDAVRRCTSGVELIDSGFGADVEVAVQDEASELVPILCDGAFRAA